jgi:Ca-activated chloride channel homolog
MLQTVSRWALELVVVSFLIELVLLGAQSGAAHSSSQGQSPCLARSGSSIAKSAAGSRLVHIPVTVMNEQGRVVPGLSKEQFVLYQDNIVQTITQVSVEKSPVSVGFVVDSSHTMVHKLDTARELISGLLSMMTRKDEFFMVEVGTKPQLLVPMTNSTSEIRRHLPQLAPSGQTALLDGLDLALNVMQSARNRHRALVVFSDGKENASQCTQPYFMEVLDAEGVQIFAVNSSLSSKFWPPPSTVGSALLMKLTDDTGGRLFEAHKPAEIPEIASTVGSCLRYRYLLSYTPSESDPRQYHRIKVKVARPDDVPPFDVMWRTGY